MPALSMLSVVFVGVTGADAGKVDAQFEAVSASAHVVRTKPSAAIVRTLARHGASSSELVQHMHVDGVISAELIQAHGHFSLRVAIYAGDGRMRSFRETSMASRVLDQAELAELREEISEELATLVPAARAPATSTIAEIDFDAPATSAVPATPPAKPNRSAPTLPKIPPSPAPSPAPNPPPTPHVTPAAPVEVASVDADAVRPDDIEAMMRGASTEGGDAAEASAPSSVAPALHLGATAGLALVGRSFTPGPSTVMAYSSSPVGAIVLGGGLEPTANTRIAVSFERTLAMSTPLSASSATTAITRWEMTGSYAIVPAVHVELGLGHRGFSIDSTDPARTPDGDYNYLIGAATGALRVGERITVSGRLAFEPVLWGVEPTKMAFGAASRWAIDAALAADVRATRHVFLRAALDYQRFAWSWDGAGARGAGGAVDGYPAATLSLGANY